MQTTVYTGGDGDRWLTTDRQHAAYFGDVTERTIECDDDRVLHLSAEDVERFYDGHGLPPAGEDAEVLDEMAFQADGYYNWICLHDWEGSGLCFFRTN